LARNCILKVPSADKDGGLGYCQSPFKQQRVSNLAKLDDYKALAMWEFMLAGWK